MAKAPRPGVGARAEAAVAAQQILVIRIGETTWKLAWRNVPMGERMLVRKWTGIAYASFTSNGEQIDEDSLALLWCLARRAAGETSLIFDDSVVEDYRQRVIDAEGDMEISVDSPDEEADDPEV